MSQMGNDQITNGLKQMMAGIESMMSGLEKLPDEVRKNMTPEEAIAFQEQMEKAKLNEHISSANQGLDDLKKAFKL